MSSANFKINKTSGSRNDSVVVTTSHQNDTGSVVAANVYVSDGTISKSVEVRQMYRPIVRWYNTSEETPTVSRMGGRLTLYVDSPYDFYMWQVPNCVGNLYQGKTFQSGENYIEVRVNTAESSSDEEYTLQIAFDRKNGIKSYNTADGRNSFFATFRQEGYVARSLTISPEDILSNWQENTFRINVTFIGRMENETLVFDYNESYPFFSWTAPVWESPTSPNGYVDVTIEENDGQSRSNYLAFMSPDQDVRMDLGIRQSPYQPSVPKVAINYNTTNCLVRPMSLMVDQNSRYEATITPNSGYKLDLNNFTINVDGDDITGDTGVLTKQSNGSWKLVIESVYGATLIEARPQQIVTQNFSVDYFTLDGIVFTSAPLQVYEGETLEVSMYVDEDYDPDSLNVEVIVDGDFLTDDNYTLTHNAGRNWSLSVPNIYGDVIINAFSVAYEIAEVGIRFDNNMRMEFYLEYPVSYDILIEAVIENNNNTYVITADQTSVYRSEEGQTYTLQDFDSHWHWAQIKHIEISGPASAHLLESMSAKFINDMDKVGNTSYNNIYWED